MPNGCRCPETCKLGRHDKKFKGKGPPPQGGGDPSPQGDGNAQYGGGRGKGGKGRKGKGEEAVKDPKGNGRGRGLARTEPERSPNKSNKLDDNAIKDEKGRYHCYAFVHGKCTKGDQCPKAHCPETTAMKLKRLKDEKAAAERNERALAAKLEKAGAPDKPEPKKKGGKKEGAGADSAGGGTKPPGT